MRARQLIVLASGCVAIACVSSSGGGDPTDAGAVDAGPDTFDAGPFDCFGLLACGNTCSTQQCVTACAVNSTPTAQRLDNALTGCVATTCPDTDGGPCASSISGACQDCTQNAQTVGQPCSTALVACIDDMSGASGDQLGSGCNALTNCLDGCQSVNCESNCISAASSVGYQLYMELSECLDVSCADVDGGPCASAGSQTCGDCEDTALSTGGACASDYDNCMNSP